MNTWYDYLRADFHNFPRKYKNTDIMGKAWFRPLQIRVMARQWVRYQGKLILKSAMKFYD